MTTTQLDGLPGWTDDERILRSKETWASEGWGSRMAHEHVITLPCTSVMCSTPESGNALLMFTDSQSVVYFWNQLANTVWKVTSPTDKAAILAALKKKPNGLVMEQMPPLEPPPDSPVENLGA